MHFRQTHKVFLSSGSGSSVANRRFSKLILSNGRSFHTKRTAIWNVVTSKSNFPTLLLNVSWKATKQSKVNRKIKQYSRKTTDRSVRHVVIPLKFATVVLLSVKLFDFGYDVLHFDGKWDLDPFATSGPRARIQDLYVYRFGQMVVTQTTRILELLIQIFADFDILEHPCKFVHILGRHSHIPEPLNHILLLFAVSRGVENQSSGEVCLMVTHKHVFVLYVFQDKQLIQRFKNNYQFILFRE